MVIWLPDLLLAHLNLMLIASLLGAQSVNYLLHNSVKFPQLLSLDIGNTFGFVKCR